MDVQGRRKYTISFKDLKTGKVLDHQIQDATANFDWAADNNTLFYSNQDKQTLRSHQICRFDLASGTDQVIFEEKDDTFSCYVWKTRSKKVCTFNL